MLFSILIPVYNVEKYLEDCLNSILKQSEKDFEIILCDDCSTDESGAICDLAAQNYPSIIRTMHNHENCGLLMTRRKLFQEARGEWILCVDSDDLLADHALEKLKTVITNTATDMVIYDLRCIHLDGTEEIFAPNLETGKLYAGGEKNRIYVTIFDNRYLNSLSTKTYRRKLVDVAENYTDYASLKIGEDLFQSFPLFDKAESIYYLHEELYLYRKNEGGMTNAGKFDLYDMRKILWDREDYYLKKWNLSDGTLNKAYDRRVREIIGYLRNGTEKLGKEWFDKRSEQIVSDGYLALAVYRSKVGLKYGLYSELVLQRKFKLFRALSELESTILKLKYRRKHKTV
jgi:glycosyltransferase involved in cell wall biosynthesis